MADGDNIGDNESVVLAEVWMQFTHNFPVNFRAELVTIFVNVEGGPLLTKVVLTESGALALAQALGKDDKSTVEMVDGKIFIGLKEDDPEFHFLEIHKDGKEKPYEVYCRHGKQTEHLIENLKVAADAVSG